MQKCSKVIDQAGNLTCSRANHQTRTMKCWTPPVSFSHDPSRWTRRFKVVG